MWDLVDNSRTSYNLTRYKRHKHFSYKLIHLLPLSLNSLEIKLNQRKARLTELKAKQKAMKESRETEKKDWESKLVGKKTVRIVPSIPIHNRITINNFKILAWHLHELQLEALRVFPAITTFILCYCYQVVQSVLLTEIILTPLISLYLWDTDNWLSSLMVLYLWDTDNWLSSHPQWCYTSETLITDYPQSLNGVVPLRHW